jgi:hypothetical protein
MYVFACMSMYAYPGGGALLEVSWGKFAEQREFEA